MLLLVGDDWAEDHHDIEIQDETGHRLARARLPEGIAGMARLHALIGRQIGDLDEADVQVVVGIENFSPRCRHEYATITADRVACAVLGLYSC